MKKSVLLCVVLLMNISLFAQFQAGNILVTGTVVFTGNQDKSTVSGTTTHGPKTTNFEIGPGVEYFLTDKISVGGIIDYSIEKEVDNDPGGGWDKTIYKSWITSLVPNASYYFINEERFGLFGRAMLGFGFGKNTDELISGNSTVTNEEKVTAFSFGVAPGIVVRLTDQFGMNAYFGELSYNISKIDDGTTVDSYSSYGLKIWPSLGFGIYYKLR